MAQTQVEETLAHLMRTVDELSEQVARQDQEIARLTRLVELLRDHAAAQSEDGGVVIGGERPPHY